MLGSDNWVPVAALVLGTVLGLAWGLWVLRVGRRERRQAEERDREQRRMLESILDNLGDGVAVADQGGRLVHFNPAAERILGVGVTDSGPDQWAQTYGLFLPDGTTPVPSSDLPLARAIQGEECRDVELFVRNPSLPRGAFITVTATPLVGPRGAIRGGVAVFREVTRQRRAQHALRESEARFRSIVEASSCALIIFSPERRIVEFNREAERIFGRPRDQVLGFDFLDVCLPTEFREIVAGDIRRVLTGETTLDLESPVRSGDGSERFLLWGFSRAVDASGTLGGVIATGHDITERREAEQSRRMRELAGHLETAREHERAHVAREIHDDLGQALTGMKYEIHHVARIADSSELRERLTAVSRLIDETIGTVRRIAAELRPQILDELGLLEAIGWQAEEFRKRTGMPCEVTLPDESIEWDADRATAMFRIFQEALTNVARHAEATRVVVSVRRSASDAMLEVTDNGRGIDPRELAERKSFGLLGMQERARLLGGSLQIVEAKPRGTRVMLRLPLVSGLGSTRFRSQ